MKLLQWCLLLLILPSLTKASMVLPIIELEAMPVEYLQKEVVAASTKISNSQDAELLTLKLLDLSSSKLARLLPLLPNNNYKKFILNYFFKKQYQRFLTILLFSKELPRRMGAEGTTAAKLLKNLSGLEQKTIISDLKKLDLDFANLISDHLNKRKIKNNFHFVEEPATRLNKFNNINDDLSFIMVEQREYIITSNNYHSYIGTTGVAPCVGLILYDKTLQIGLVAHFDGLSHIEDSLDRMLLDLRLRGVDLFNLQAAIIGGEYSKYDSSKSSAVNVYQVIKRLREEQITVKNFDILGQGSVTGRSFVLSLKDGKIYNLVNRVRPYEESQKAKERLWNSSHTKFCESYMYRHEQSLPSVGVSEEQYLKDQECY